MLDLVETPEREVRMGFDYDFKRRPVEVSERDGLLHVTTAPWETVDDFQEFRDQLERWRRDHRRVLRTRRDWDDVRGWLTRKSLLFRGSSNFGCVARYWLSYSCGAGRDALTACRGVATGRSPRP